MWDHIDSAIGVHRRYHKGNAACTNGSLRLAVKPKQSPSTDAAHVDFAHEFKLCGRRAYCFWYT